MEYEKEKLITDIDESEKNKQLIQTIIITKKELNKAHSNFEFAEEELVDFYSYQIKALQTKLDYLIRIAKVKNLNYNFFNKKVV